MLQSNIKQKLLIEFKHMKHDIVILTQPAFHTVITPKMVLEKTESHNQPK